MTERPELGSGAPRWKRPPWPMIAAGAGVLVLVGAAITASLLLAPTTPGPSETSGPSGPSAPATTEPTAGDETGEPSPGETLEPIFGEPVADVVGPDEVADFGDDVTARLVAVTPFTATGSQAGEVSGPAVRVEIELHNGTGAAISLDAVTVNAYFGADTQPAPPIGSDGAPFTGSLEPGGTAVGSYAFSVPEGETVVITVNKSPGSPIVVFQ